MAAGARGRPGAERPLSRIDLAAIQRASTEIDPIFRDTPQFESLAVSRACGVRVVLKVETVNPIRSFKGRGADWLCERLALPAGAELVCASAGNFGQGLAWAGTRRGLRVTVFAARTANPFKVERMRSFGAEVRLEGQDFAAAKEAAHAHAADTGGRFIEDGREPPISEGAGTIAVELGRWPDPFDAILVPIGDGALIAGIGTWATARMPGTRVIGVCAAGAPALALSWRAGKPVSTPSAETIADGIWVRDPVPEALADLQPVVDDVVLVEDGSMIDAMRLLFAETGLVVEPAGAAGLAALLEHGGRWRGARVATPVCGGNLTREQIARWLMPAGNGVSGLPVKERSME
jgi:threonine dehydratase